MSITSILSGKNFPKLRTKLKTDFPRPIIKLKGDLIAPPNTKNYSIVGAAFDYACRFIIERENLDNNEVTINSSDSVIAERMIERMELNYGKKPVKKKTKESFIDFHFTESRELNRFNTFQNIKEELYKSKRLINHFRNEGVVSDKFYQACIVFAKLDLFARIGRIDETIKEVVQEDIEDLKRLVSIIPNEIKNPKIRAVLNPTLPVGGMGGDGDLIIDDKLIDIKTTKDLKLNRATLNQIICYYTGYLENDRYKELNVNEIGIYFARHGVLWTIKTEKLGTDDMFLDFGRWLKVYLKTRNPMEKESPEL